MGTCLVAQKFTMSPIIGAAKHDPNLKRFFRLAEKHVIPAWNSEERGVGLSTWPHSDIKSQ